MIVLDVKGRSLPSLRRCRPNGSIITVPLPFPPCSNNRCNNSLCSWCSWEAFSTSATARCTHSPGLQACEVSVREASTCEALLVALRPAHADDAAECARIDRARAVAARLVAQLRASEDGTTVDLSTKAAVALLVQRAIVEFEDELHAA